MKEFKINDRITIKCEYKKTQNGFKHTAKLFINGACVNEVKKTYLNRTWESYQFQSVMQKLIEDTKRLTDFEKIECNKFTQDYKEDNPFGAVVMAAKIGEILTDTKEEQNKWKQRMMKAGLGEGVSFPADWDQLSEDEKERRLNGALDQLK